MAKKFFPSSTDALLWAARFTQEVARVVAMTTVAGETWVGCGPVVVRFFEDEDNHYPLYIAYRAGDAAWADVIADAVRTVLEDSGVPIRRDYRLDYADGSYDFNIETKAVKVEIVRESWLQ